MGSNSHDRDLRLARTAYIAAVRRLDAAMRQFDASDIPMDPRGGASAAPVVSRARGDDAGAGGAFTAVVDRRREWDRLRREGNPPH